MDISNIFLSRNVPVNNLQPAFHTGKDNFIAQVQQARMSPQQQDTVSLSSRSYEERLSELRKMHENTDYSGMSGKEIARLLQSRFENAFPNYGAISGGFYLCAGEHSIYEKIREAESLQLTEALNGEKPWEKEPGGLVEYRKYIFGYEGFSDDEIMSALNEKYSGGTLADRYGMAWEMLNLGLGDHQALGNVLAQIREEMVKGTENQYSYLNRDNPLRISAMIGYGENTTIGWTQLIKNLYEERKSWKYESETVKNQMLNELEEQLNRLLGQLGLPRADLN